MTTRPDPETPAWKTKQFRLIVFGALAVLALILILQNFDTTEVQFLFWTGRAPLAWVLLSLFGVWFGRQLVFRVRVPASRSRREARYDEPATRPHRR